MEGRCFGTPVEFAVELLEMAPGDVRSEAGDDAALLRRGQQQIERLRHDVNVLRIGVEAQSPQQRPMLVGVAVEQPSHAPETRLRGVDFEGGVGGGEGAGGRRRRRRRREVDEVERSHGLEQEAFQGLGVEQTAPVGRQENVARTQAQKIGRRTTLNVSYLDEKGREIDSRD